MVEIVDWPEVLQPEDVSLWQETKTRQRVEATTGLSKPAGIVSVQTKLSMSGIPQHTVEQVRAARALTANMKGGATLVRIKLPDPNGARGKNTDEYQRYRIAYERGLKEWRAEWNRRHLEVYNEYVRVCGVVDRQIVQYPFGLPFDDGTYFDDGYGFAHEYPDAPKRSETEPDIKDFVPEFSVPKFEVLLSTAGRGDTALHIDTSTELIGCFIELDGFVYMVGEQDGQTVGVWPPVRRAVANSAPVILEPEFIGFMDGKGIGTEALKLGRIGSTSISFTEDLSRLM
ncbi:hypothetical protein PsAD5_02910 [Pseudovibrio sp. Ad5]|uniref:hypothetical protein n=1 Tax=Pseudovibrio sp. Ad5 TaxID=989436 RepID=UPI0007AE4DBF|nr:hypothetical protein [Pseudovibrio sp. Ad5]KZK95146.1 hypothetical protein PsAD5_02910 [Pseudovibrio sp. Ad5]